MFNGLLQHQFLCLGIQLNSALESYRNFTFSWGMPSILSSWS